MSYACCLLPLVVAHGAALEAEIAHPVLGARVRAAVEVELQLADRSTEADLEPLDERGEAGLRLRHREVAVRLPGASDRARADRVDVGREADLPEPRFDALHGLLSDAGEHEVLLACDAQVGAEQLGEVGERDHLRAAREPDVHGHPDRPRPVVLEADAHVVVIRLRVRRQDEVGQRAAETLLDVGSSSPPGRCRRP